MKKVYNSQNKRIIGLDYFRIALAILIFLFHSAIHMNCFYGIFQEFIEMGAVAMTGFFMLSGYSLYQSYSKQEFSEIKAVKIFLKKRFVSLMPGYIMIIIIFFCGYGEESLLKRILLLPIDILNVEAVYSSLFSISHYGGTWFISCIVLCYIVFPYALNIVKQLMTREKLMLVGLICFLLLYSPFIVWIFGLNSTYSNPFFRSLEFLLGILLASLYSDINENVKGKFFNKKLLLVEVFLLIVGVTIAIKLGIAVGNYTLYSSLALPIWGMIIFTLHNIEFKNRKWISYASEISYPFFLAQLFIWSIMKNLLNFMKISSNVAIIIISLVVCIILAIMIHEIIEKNGKKLIKKILHI